MKEIFDKHNLIIGRMVSWSKSTYRTEHPTHEVIFNANIFSTSGKIWYGDLDLTLDGEKIQAVADELGVCLFVLREMDGRFKNESLTLEQMAAKAVKTFYPNE
jgi:hypothetical protein